MFIVNKKISLVLALFMVFMTIGLPAAQIARYENVITNGTSYKLKCRAYDPYDPFMGRYVRLNLSETVQAKDVGFMNDVSEKDHFYHQGFVEISANENGFVKYEKLVKDTALISPEKDYLKCSIYKEYGTTDTIRINIDNIDRYYMTEKLAQPAEDAVREALRSDDESTNKIVYLELKVLNTLAVPMQLYIDDTKIEDYIHD